MRPTAEMARSIWWGFAVAGAIAAVAAAAMGLALAAPTRAVGAGQLLGGIALLIAAARVPGGITSALPFLGAAVAGIVLGGFGVVLPSEDPRIALIAIGLWSVLAGAGYLAVARIARGLRVPDGGLLTAAWAAIGAGAAISTLPAFKLGASTVVPTAALALSAAITIVASLRLRTLPDEAPGALSKREQRRRDRDTRGA